jgi:hypothetical protein
MDTPVEVTVAALLVALADVGPTPKNTTALPLFCTRYWVAAALAEVACTGVGAVVNAVNATVLPIGVKALTDITLPFAFF